METSLDPSASYVVHMYPANQLDVVAGVNEGEPLGPLDEACLGDTYRIAKPALPWRLTIRDGGETEAGQAFAVGGDAPVVISAPDRAMTGAALYIRGTLHFITPEGHRVDMAAVDLIGPNGQWRFLLPRSPFARGEHHILLNISDGASGVSLCDITPMAFARGTRIALADGTSCPVEDLSIGDAILTRDNGPRPIRWLGHKMVRAVGGCAPVIVRKGYLANDRDLMVSQFQRLYLPHPHSSQPVLITAGELAAGTDAQIREGGTVEYYHIALDTHEIIYAEYIPTESLLINRNALRHLPADMGAEARRLRHAPHRTRPLNEIERLTIAPEAFRKDRQAG